MRLITITLLWMVASAQKKVENVALRARVTQSSVTLQDPYGYASNAIDGNSDPMYFNGSCFSTERQRSPWMRVDLLDTYEISEIIITNRGDCCPELVNGAEVLVGSSLANNGNDNPRCATVSTIPLKGTQAYSCPNMRGRYVNVILRDITRHLSFCEIQIMGVPAKKQICFDIE